MSKTMNVGANIRWKLLASASAAALISSAYMAGEALAADDNSGRPQVWIELGAQLERASGGDGAFAPPFYSDLAPSLDSPAKIASELPLALGPEAKISFQPEESDWIFSAGIRYGRAKNHRSLAQATVPPSEKFVAKYQTSAPGYSFWGKCCHTSTFPANKANFAGVQSRHQESHLVLDFQAGKDIGLGLFGQQGTSALNAGVRFAQFRTRSDISVKARTDFEAYNALALPGYSYIHSQYPQKYFPGYRFRTYSLQAGSSRSFQGVGPSISWDASATLAGSSETSQLTFDWGINAALLFGKQKSKTHHESSGHQFYGYYNSYRPHTHPGYVSLYNHPRVHYTRSRRVTVPNLGGMAGFSIKFPNAKVSIGYRADIFFGAMDGGWDTAKKQNRSFMGPFASISVGIGN